MLDCSRSATRFNPSGSCHPDSATGSGFHPPPASLPSCWLPAADSTRRAGLATKCTQLVRFMPPAPSPGCRDAYIRCVPARPACPELHTSRRQCNGVIEWPRWREFQNRAIAEHQAASDCTQGMFHGADMGAVVRIAQPAHCAFTLVDGFIRYRLRSCATGCERARCPSSDTPRSRADPWTECGLRQARSPPRPAKRPPGPSADRHTFP